MYSQCTITWKFILSSSKSSLIIKKNHIYNTPRIINNMNTPCINTNQQTNDFILFYYNFVCLQVIVYFEYMKK